jgi:hypothetical protein
VTWASAGRDSGRMTDLRGEEGPERQPRMVLVVAVEADRAGQREPVKAGPVECVTLLPML